MASIEAHRRAFRLRAVSWALASSLTAQGGAHTAQGGRQSHRTHHPAPLSVINALIVAISKKKQEEVSETFAKLEAIWEEYDVYANNNGKS